MIVADVYFSRVVGVCELVVERKEGKEKRAGRSRCLLFVFDVPDSQKKKWNTRLTTGYKVYAAEPMKRFQLLFSRLSHKASDSLIS